MIDKILQIVNSKLLVTNEPLLDGQETSLLTADVASGVSSITVDNISGYGVGKYILIGSFGDPNAEIIRIHTSTAPTGTTITLNSNLTQAHAENSPITLVDFNQVEYSRATTLTGSKSVLNTVDITADREQTFYADTINTTGYAFFRFKNSADSVYSEYSAGVAYQPSERSYDTLRTVADKALRFCKEKINASITYEHFLDFAEDFYQELYTYKRNWRLFRTLDTSVSTTPNVEYITLPVNVDSIDQIKLNTNEPPLIKVNLNQFNKLKTVTTTGSPYYYHQIDRNIYFYPTPTSIKTVYLYHFFQPTRITTIDDVIDATRTGLFLLSVYFRYRIYDTIASKPDKSKEWSNKFYALLDQIGSREEEESIGENDNIEVTKDWLYDDDTEFYDNIIVSM